MEKEKLTVTIQAAFQGVKLGKGISIRQADIVDRYSQGECLETARNLDEVNCWENIPSDLLEKHGVLNHMDEEGVRFYLPAYMLWTLENWDRSDSLTSDSVGYFFSHASSRELCQLLDGPQKESVAEFLLYCSNEAIEIDLDLNGARKAIRRILQIERE